MGLEIQDSIESSALRYFCPPVMTMEGARRETRLDRLKMSTQRAWDLGHAKC